MGTNLWPALKQFNRIEQIEAHRSNGPCQKEKAVRKSFKQNFPEQKWLKRRREAHYFHEAHGRRDRLNESHFKILRKCQGKFDCLVFEMLYIKKFQPNLNV